MIDLIDRLPPGALLIVGGLCLTLLRGRWQQLGLVLLPLLSAAHLAYVVNANWSVINDPHGLQIPLHLFAYDLTPIRIDRLSLVWGCIFHIAALLSAVYAWHLKDAMQHVSAMTYAGVAIGAVFAGDLITFFIYWELATVSSVFLIWASRNARSYRAGMRYLIIQVTSGLILLSGILLHFRDTDSLAFLDAFHRILPATEDRFLGLNSVGTALIFLAFGIKAAFPLLHNWLEDAYPEATVTGTVFLSAFTTKLAIYALARGFPGTELLIWIGATMAVFPLIFATIENDLRRVLAYCLNNQLGFMVVGVGLANFAKYPEVAQLAINGTAAQAFAHVLYKSLLFMATGAVLFRTGTIKASELGGLYKSMPWTMTFCMIGTAAMSAPLFCGFVTKSLVISAVAERHLTVVWLILYLATAGVFMMGIKVVFCAFFAHDTGHKVVDAPRNMITAMGMGAALCIFVGVAPQALYGILPYHVEYSPYTASHVVTQLQLLAFSGLAFAALKLTGVYPAEQPSVVLDSDWLYRKPLPAAAHGLFQIGVAIRAKSIQIVLWILTPAWSWIRTRSGSQGALGRSWTTGGMVIWAAIMLGAYLILYYM